MMNYKSGFVLIGILGFFLTCIQNNDNIHVWEKVEITLQADQDYANPYTDVDVWVQLKGPNFDKRCYGFWDGDKIWRIRVMATAPGEWSWISGSNQKDPGLKNRTGSFKAIEWTEAEKQENPLRRGMIRATTNGHAFEYADGTPMFWLADTWWSCMTKRFYWNDDDIERAVGTPEAGFKDYVRFRKSQGYNGCMVIAGFPHWTEEDSDWGGGDWEDESGNRPFWGDDSSPDLNKINPAYFQSMDKKVDHLNQQGWIPFIEIARRDIYTYWKDNFYWPESYARYMRYIYFRYQANMIFNSPIHLDFLEETQSGEEWNQIANSIIEDYEWPPFDNQSSANPPQSTYDIFGHTDTAKWLTFHSVGNWQRDHRLFPPITTMFYLDNPVPCMNNEPYYDGLKWGNDANLGSDLAAYYSRVALYGSVLSGGLAGHVYGADHVWDGDEKMPQAMLIQSAEQMQNIYPFLFSEGDRYQQLEPQKDLLQPHQTQNIDNNMGWAYCMRTPDKEYFLIYFENGCDQATLSGTLASSKYNIEWFDPREGSWSIIGDGLLTSDSSGTIPLPAFPDNSNPSNTDWGLKLVITK